MPQIPVFRVHFAEKTEITFYLGRIALKKGYSGQNLNKKWKPDFLGRVCL